MRSENRLAKKIGVCLVCLTLSLGFAGCRSGGEIDPRTGLPLGAKPIPANDPAAQREAQEKIEKFRERSVTVPPPGRQ